MKPRGLDLSGLKVLVTGGAGYGVGGGITESLYHSGATVVVNDIDVGSLNVLQAAFPDMIPIVADITDAEQVDQMFEEIETKCGGVNGLVNSAGIGLSKLSHEVSEAEYDRLNDLDVKAVWRVSKCFVNRCLSRAQGGSIVHISSVQAFASQKRYALYCSAKNAIIGMTKGMACELGPLGFRVNAVGPGYVHSEQNLDLIKTWHEDPKQWVSDLLQKYQLLDHEIKSTDIGNAVAFLLSDMARSITGQNLYVDCGLSSMLFARDFI